MRTSRFVTVLLAFFFWTVWTGVGFSDGEPKPLEFRNSSQTVGDLTLTAESVGFLTDFSPHTINYTLENRSKEKIEANCVFTSTDTICPLGDDKQPTGSIERTVTVEPGASANLAFSYAAFEGTYRAHYPLRLKATTAVGGEKVTLEAIRVIEAQIPTAADTSLQTTVFERGGSLIGKNYRAWCDIKGENRRELGVSFRGGDKETGASVALEQAVRGESRRALNCHPPYIPAGGSLWLEFPVRLPAAERVSLAYGCAIRPHTAQESPSDGVTFRVWGSEPAAGATSPDTGNFETKTLLDEIHTDSRTWQDRSVDLTPLAGKCATIWVEMNPGQANDTNCDGCSVSGLIISAQNGGGPPPAEPMAPVTFALADGFSAIVAPGANGLFDGTITLQNADGKSVAYHGLSIAVAGVAVNDFGAMITEPPVCEYDKASGKITCRAVMTADDRNETITIQVYEQNGLLILGVPSGNPARVGGLRLGTGSEKLARIYFGHGAVAERLTGRIQVEGEGHRLSTRHVGVDYANGLSVLLASETPPESVQADPQTNLFTLNIDGVTRLAILPSQNGAFASAVKFRSISPWQESSSKGVARKAGRLVFDIWGGRFEENRAALESAFLYGVVDSLVVKHVWQRWGYDVRLPDIWGESESDAVLPQLGRLEELRILADTCVSRSVPFALHDNYIDYYPDADGFSYDKIVFDRNGSPHKAWINHGARAQSYRWRPDLFAPLLERNMALAQKYLPQMDAYFVDVFSSIHLFSFFDRDGNFHPLSQTRDGWKKGFETIGSMLAHEKNGEKETAITISEAGNDFLIGSLDGADCQWLALSNKGSSWTIPVAADRWERTPWFAAVNHTNFSRHGVGYESRYVGALDPALHGMMSDDYLSMELLGGVDLMVEQPTVFPGAVRKHYFAQHIVRSRAAAEIESLTFEPDENQGTDIQRQTVRWSDGTVVRANRSDSDWRLSDKTVLPSYGVSAENPNGMLAVICRNPANSAEIIEYSHRADGSFYVNGRGISTRELYAVSPRLAVGEALDHGRFKIAVDWTADSPLPQKLSTFVHVFEPYLGYGHTPKGWYAGGSAPAVPTDVWGTPGHETVRTDETIFTVPEDIPAGHYEIRVGLFDPVSGKRYPLIGETDRQTRYTIAALDIRRNGENVDLSIQPVPMRERRELFLRLFGNKTPAAFGGVETLGAVYVTSSETAWSVLPIPVIGGETFDVTLDEGVIGKKITKITSQGADVPFRRDGGRVTLSVTAKDAVRYEAAF